MDSWGLGAQKGPRDQIIQSCKLPGEKHWWWKRSERMARPSDEAVMTTSTSRSVTPGPLLLPAGQPACYIDWGCDRSKEAAGKAPPGNLFPHVAIFLVKNSVLTGMSLGCQAAHLPWMKWVASTRIVSVYAVVLEVRTGTVFFGDDSGGPVWVWRGERKDKETRKTRRSREVAIMDNPGSSPLGNSGVKCQIYLGVIPSRRARNFVWLSSYSHW